MAFDFSTAKKAALISGCKRYRYWLSREWDASKPKMVFVMLNPSVADADIDDPTIRRCMGFAAREGCGGIVVVNIFAFRATDPQELVGNKIARGEHNDDWQYEWISQAARDGAPVVLAWGAHKTVTQEAKRFLDYYAEMGIDLYCLGQTKSGAPKHPLYIASDQPLVLYAA